MKNNLKIIAMLLFIATIVFAAGCAEKTTNPENETPSVSNQTAPIVVTTSSPVKTSNVTETANDTVIESDYIENIENITTSETTTKLQIRKSTYVTPHQPSSEANQITYTSYNSKNNTPVVSNKQGTLKIISSGANTTQENTTQGNTTQIGDPSREQKITQNHTSTNKSISI